MLSRCSGDIASSVSLPAAPVLVPDVKRSKVDEPAVTVHILYEFHSCKPWDAANIHQQCNT